MVNNGGTIFFGTFIALIAAFLPLSEIAKLVNIGTLFAFFVVNAGVIILRHTQPVRETIDIRIQSLHFAQPPKSCLVRAQFSAVT